MAKNKMSPETSIFRGVFAGVAGAFSVIILIGLICVILFGTGWYLIVKYNKKGTKYFEDIQPMQYVGIVLCVLACLPFIQYFFMGLLFNAGGAVFDGMFN